jgi:hypothetical protein
MLGSPPKFAATVPERSNNVSVDYQAMSRASDFLASDALPSVERWRADETNLGLAKLAAVNLNQMVDHYFYSFSAGASQLLGKTNVGGLRAELRNRYPSFALVNDVADAHKHVRLDRSSA